MDHSLVGAVERALGWDGPGHLGAGFAHGAMSDRALCDRLLTPTKLLDLVMRRSLAPPQLRVFQGGIERHPDSYLSTQVTRRGQSLTMANMDRLAQLMRAGCTVVLDALDVFDPVMEVACRALQWWTRELVQVNTYLTTNEATGFSLHWDDHDVVVVQLAGQKSWEVRGSSRPAPMYRDAAPNDEPADEIVWVGTMRAGDVMHIPRGYWHRATRAGHGEGFSLHITFGIVKRTGVDYLAWVADRARCDLLFRTDLDRWGGPARLGEQQQILRAAFEPLLADNGAAEYLNAREYERSPARHVATGGVFGPPSSVVCVTDFQPEVVVNDDGLLRVDTVGKRMIFAARAEPVLRQLLSGHPVDIGQLTRHTGIDTSVIAEALIKEGVCAELTGELCSGYTGLITGEHYSRLP